MRNSRGLSKLVWLAIIAWFLVTAVVAWWVISDAMRPEYEKKLAAALEANKKGDKDTAAALLIESVALAKKAKAKGEGMIQPLRWLAWIYETTDDYQRAGDFYRETLEIARADSEFAKRLTLACLCDWQKDAYERGVIEKQDPRYADEFLAGQTKQPLTFYGQDLIRAYQAKAYYLIANKDYKQADELIKKGLAEKNISGWELDKPRIESLVGQGKARDAIEVILEAKKKYSDNRDWPTRLEQSLRAASGDPSGSKGMGNISVLFKVQQLVAERDFAGLDKYAAELIASKAQDRSGHWNIEDFYDAVSISNNSLNTRFEERKAFLNDWLKARPDSDSAKIALADLLENYAWKARGSGYASTVSKEGWKLFAERLQQARDVLAKVKKRDPVYYSTEQTLALGQGWQRADYEKLYTECRNVYPDYQNAIQQKMNWLRARWFGEEGDSLRVLEEECNKLPGIAGDILYAKICARLVRTSYWNLREEPAIDWARAKRGFKAMIAAAPDSLWPRADMASVAIEVEEKDDAKAAFDTLTH